VSVDEEMRSLPLLLIPSWRTTPTYTQLSQRHRLSSVLHNRTLSNTSQPRRYRLVAWH